jgi:hypothetical protein
MAPPLLAEEENNKDAPRKARKKENFCNEWFSIPE